MKRKDEGRLEEELRKREKRIKGDNICGWKGWGERKRVP